MPPPTTTHLTVSTFLFLLFLLSFSISSASGYGSMGPISAAFSADGEADDDGFFCAIDASGKQNVICWGKNSSLTSPTSATPYFGDIPPMAALSGGQGFICGIMSNTSQAYCWSLNVSANSNNLLVPPMFRSTAYSYVAAGRNHVCAIRGSYYSENDSGTVDCWDIALGSNGTLPSGHSSSYYNQSIDNLVFNKVVSGDGFACGSVREGGVVCWGPKSSSLGVSGNPGDFKALASGRSTLCGILVNSSEVECWGDTSSPVINPPPETRFVGVTAGAHHFCGIREEDHGVECWGNFNLSSVPKGSGFMAIASSDFTTCGIREEDLVLDCWFANVSLTQGYEPPLQLCSPGLCTPHSCGEGTFTFNASKLNEPDLVSLCVRNDLQICSPCGFNCSEGFFLSSACTENADRVCTACSLCQNSSCAAICNVKLSSDTHRKHQAELRRFLLIVGASGLGFVLILTSCWCFLPPVLASSKRGGFKKADSKTDTDAESYPPLSAAPSFGTAQIFRLSELKDATNGFKEFNELGRGSYGFVYKAVLADGHQVAVKRANAATIIHTNSRDFEMELEVLCKIRHYNIVNLLGYCSEMGERLLVYEFMPNGTLHDHLHGGLSPLNWNYRLRISVQAAKGLEYLHKEADPPIAHRDVKTSNILLDAELGARIADFGLLTPCDRDIKEDMKADIFNFGIVLLEVLSGRKAYDVDYTPSSIVDWAVPLIREGKAAAVVDRYIALPRNFEPLLKLAEIAELALREDPNERPAISDLVIALEQIVKDGLML